MEFVLPMMTEELRAGSSHGSSGDGAMTAVEQAVGAEEDELVGRSCDFITQLDVATTQTTHSATTERETWWVKARVVTSDEQNLLRLRASDTPLLVLDPTTATVRMVGMGTSTKSSSSSSSNAGCSDGQHKELEITRGSVLDRVLISSTELPQPRPPPTTPTPPPSPPLSISLQLQQEPTGANGGERVYLLCRGVRRDVHYRYATESAVRTMMRARL